jgi:hypothetical protein
MRSVYDIFARPKFEEKTIKMVSPEIDDIIAMIKHHEKDGWRLKDFFRSKGDIKLLLVRADNFAEYD